MNRRAFLSALVAAPVAHELEPVRRVYSFLWAPPEPAVRPPSDDELKFLAARKAEIDAMFDRMGREFSMQLWGITGADAFLSGYP